MATTYTPIATQTLTSGATTVTFSSIPSTYTDLILSINCSTSEDAAGVTGQINGDTASNYSITELYGNGTSATSSRWSNTTGFAVSSYAMGISNVNPSTLLVHFMDYASTTKQKTILSRSSDGSKGVSALVSNWRSTSAINSITIRINGVLTLNSGSTFNLYGITKASTPVAKATGGTITTISGYTVHTFTSTGTFTPSEDLQVEYLVVAGGGGGYFNGGSAGGAGGFRTNVGGGLLSCSSGTAYTTTVGAGAGTNADGSPSSFNGINASGGGGASGGSNLGGPGGSGAGGRTSLGAGGAGNIGGYFPVEGYAGGRGGNDGGGGGGGGAGAVGNNGSGGTGGAGGIGRESLISGSSVYYAGGGGGNSAAGGTGGGGAGRVGAGAGGNGTANTGGGGGGSREGSGGNGGSGIVIVRYRN